MNAFRGEIERKAYEEEAAAVKILVADLQGDYAPQVDALSLSVWLIEIASAQTAFEQVFLQRSAEHVDRPQERLKDVRREIEAVYRQIVERLDAYTVMNGEGLTGDFIAKLNDEITYFNEHNRHHRVPKDINLATVASIPDQPWDGQPATPLPDAVDEEGKPLVFGRDYDLRYRDNEQPGNATVTLHGHSAWKGKKTVSFNIMVNG
jgi:hypothetical protein